jgi:membrane fusion protein (multidrug efflux system)
MGGSFLLSCFLLACGGEPPAPPSPGPAQVTVMTLRAEPLTLTRELPGRASAHLVAEVRPQVSGIVERRLFTEGGLVKAGQTLYQLDDAVYRAEHENAQAALAKAEAARQAADLAATRATELRARDAVSEQERENAVAALRSAEADVAAARAMVERNRLNLRYASIAAPIGGRIGMSMVTAGALVTQNQEDPLAVIQQLDPIYVDVQQSSADWLRLQRDLAEGRIVAGSDGAPVSIRLEDGSTYPHPGKLQFADVTVDEATGSFTLRILVPNPDATLRPGMYVTAVLAEGKDRQAILAPQQGITRDPKGGATAMVVEPDGKVAVRTVEVSRTVGDRWLVESGLADGDRLIVEGLQKVVPGAPAEAVEANPAAPAAPATQASPSALPEPGAPAAEAGDAADAEAGR